MNRDQSLTENPRWQPRTLTKLANWTPSNKPWIKKPRNRGSRSDIKLNSPTFTTSQILMNHDFWIWFQNCLNYFGTIVLSPLSWVAVGFRRARMVSPVVAVIEKGNERNKEGEIRERAWESGAVAGMVVCWRTREFSVGLVEQRRLADRQLMEGWSLVVVGFVAWRVRLLECFSLGFGLLLGLRT